MKKLIAVLAAVSCTPVYAYDTVREGEYVWACLEDGEVVSRHDTQYRAVVDCGKLVDGDGKERHIDFGGLRVFSDAPEPEPVPDLTFMAEPNPVAAGAAVTLSWQGTGDCTISAAGQTQPVLAVDSLSVVLPQTVTATFACGALSTEMLITVLDEVPEPTPEPTPDPPPPTASCGEPYRGIPDPCAHLGYDVFAPYAADQTVTGEHGDHALSCAGTATDPCVIDATGATFRRLGLSGSHVILQGGTVNAPASGGPMFSSSGCASCVVRDLEVSGPGTDQSHSSAVSLGNGNVWLRGSIHGFGDNRPEAGEQDFHGIKTRGSDIWILDAEIYDVSGDSVQCGDASRGSCERIYIGGGYFHHNRENGVDIKDSRGVVVSGVRMEGFAPTQSSSGVALVIHDDAFDARIYDNVIRDTRIGIVSSGMSGHIIEGNQIVASYRGIELRATTDLTVRDNTIQAPECIDVQGGTSGEIQTGCN